MGHLLGSCLRREKRERKGCDQELHPHPSPFLETKLKHRNIYLLFGNRRALQTARELLLLPTRSDSTAAPSPLLARWLQQGSASQRDKSLGFPHPIQKEKEAKERQRDRALPFSPLFREGNSM